jgi:hypothetical protein
VDCLQACPSDLLTEDNKEALAVVASIEEKQADVQRTIEKYLNLDGKIKLFFVERDHIGCHSGK